MQNKNSLEMDFGQLKNKDSSAKLHGFKKNNKIVQAKEYKYLSKKGKKIITPYFIALFLKNALPDPRLGITVSKRVSKSAVKRNRVKRLLREFFRLSKNKLQPIDIVIIARQRANEAKCDDISRDLDRLWEKLPLL